MFENHYHEQLPESVEAILESIDCEQRKKSFYDLLKEFKIKYHGVVIPTSFLPRVIPLEYAKTIDKTAKTLTKILLRTLYCDENKEVLSNSALNQHFIKNHKVLDHLPKFLIGGVRYDLAVEGHLHKNNPPKLLEVNMIDYGGCGWIPYTQKAFLEIVPELQPLLWYTHFGHHLGELLKERAKKILMVTPGETDDYLTAKDIMTKGVDVTIINDETFISAVRKKKLICSQKGIDLKNQHYDFLHMRGLSTPEDMQKYEDVIHTLIKQEVPICDHFATVLLEDKGLVFDLQEVLPLITKRNEDYFLEKVFLKTERLTHKRAKELLKEKSLEKFVLKHSNKHYSEGVYFDANMKKKLLNQNFTPALWTIQEKVKLNVCSVDVVGDREIKGCKERIKNMKGEGVADLAVYAIYVWDGVEKKLLACKTAGLLSRCNPQSYKVNVSYGGCILPLYVEKSMDLSKIVH